MSPSGPRYSYDRFTAEHYDLREFGGPRVGELAPALVATDLEGNPVSLADFLPRTIVVETGSVTCNMYASNKHEMETIRQRYPEMLFILLYVREAHPGKNIPQTNSEEKKRANAMHLRDTGTENRLILVDDVDGTAHRQLGALPNSIHIIDGEGRILYRKDWNVADEVSSVLAEIREQLPLLPRNDRATTLELLHRKLHFGVVIRAGIDAVLDVIKATPSLVKSHIVTDREKPATK